MTLGALNLLSVTQAPMDEADVIVARAFADLATLSITQHRASAEAQRLNEQLSAALTSRVVIEQAKGVISERAGVDLAEAFSRLRAYARNQQPAPHRCRPGRHRRHPRSPGLGPASPSGALLSTRRGSVPAAGRQRATCPPGPAPPVPPPPCHPGVLGRIGAPGVNSISPAPAPEPW